MKITRSRILAIKVPTSSTSLQLSTLSNDVMDQKLPVASVKNEDSTSWQCQNQNHLVGGR